MAPEIVLTRSLAGLMGNLELENENPQNGLSTWGFTDFFPNPFKPFLVIFVQSTTYNYYLEDNPRTSFSG